MNFKHVTTPKIVAAGAVVCGIIAVVSYSAMEIGEGVRDAPAKTIDSTTDSIVRLIEKIKDVTKLNPQASYESTIVVEKEREISEWAVLEQNINHEFQYKTNWGGSEKSITLRADFTAKYGYKFSSPVELNFTKNMDAVEVVMPQAQLLTLELDTSTLKIVENEGVWNKIQDEDRQAALNVFKYKAREALVERDWVKKVDERTLQDIMNCLKAEDINAEVKRVIP